MALRIFDLDAVSEPLVGNELMEISLGGNQSLKIEVGELLTALYSDSTTQVLSTIAGGIRSAVQSFTFDSTTTVFTGDIHCEGFLELASGPRINAVSDDDTLIGNSTATVVTERAIKSFLTNLGTDTTRITYDGTSDLRISLEEIVDVKYTDFQTGLAAPPWREGRVFWDEDNHTFGVYNDVSAVTLQVGQETHIRVKNQTAAPIADGSVVYINGASGQTPLISLAYAADHETICNLCMATHTIGVGEFGYVTVRGMVRGINTNAFTAGDKLYVSHTVPGAVVNTEPPAPNQVAFIGTVIVKGNNGSILVNPDHHGSSYEISDVYNNGGVRPDNSILVWDATAGYYITTDYIISIDATLAENSNTNIPTEAAVKAYVTDSISDASKNDYILFPQKIKNYNTAKGMYGLEASDWGTDGAVTIRSSVGNFVAVTALRNGGFMTAVKDGVPPTDGTAFVNVYQLDGTVVVKNVFIANGVSNHMDMKTLNNGNVVVTYRDELDSNKGKFIILDEQANIVKAITEFSNGSSVETTWGGSIVPLMNGKFMLLYSTDSASIQTVTYDKDGTELDRPDSITLDIYGAYFDTALTHDGNILMSYLDNGDYEMEYLLLDPTGSSILQQTVIKTDCNDVPICAVYNNGNFFVGWYDDCDTGNLAYRIYDSEGNTVLGQTAGPAATYYKRAIPLHDGNMAVLCLASGAPGWQIFYYDEQGTLYKTLTLATNTGGSLLSGIPSSMSLMTNGTLVAGVTDFGPDIAKYALASPSEVTLTGNLKVNSSGGVQGLSISDTSQILGVDATNRISFNQIDSSFDIISGDSYIYYDGTYLAFGNFDEDVQLWFDFVDPEFNVNVNSVDMIRARNNGNGTWIQLSLGDNLPQLEIVNTSFIFRPNITTTDKELTVDTNGIKLLNGVSANAILDENDMASDSTSALATQASIKAYVDSKGWTYTSIVNTTSGTSVTLTAAIPADALDIEILFNGVSTTANSEPPIVRLGDAGGVETTGYSGTVRGPTGETTVTDGFYPFRTSAWAAADVLHGRMRLTRWDPSLHEWLADSACEDGSSLSVFSGVKTTSQVMTTIVLTTPGGTETFDAGSARVRYK